MTQSVLSRFRSPVLVALLVIPIVVMLASAKRRQPGAATISVQPDQTFQVIHGWEAVSQAALYELDRYDHRQEVLDELFDKTVEVGLTRMRLGAPSGIENTRDFATEYAQGRISRDEERCGRYSTVNDNGDPNRLDGRGFIWTRFDREVRETILPIARRLEARGEKLWLNVQYTAFTDSICRGYAYDHDKPAEYAEFALAVFEHLRDDFGLVPDTWEIMLEPDNTRLWTPPLLAEVTAAAATRLQAAGFTPAFVGPGVMNAGNALSYFEELWQRAPLRPLLKELSYHRYGGATQENIGNIGRLSRERGVPTSMLEFIGADYQTLFQDLTLGNVSAWQQFALSWPSGDTGAHLFILDPTQPPGQRAQLSATGQYLRQYFRAMRPGAQRIGAVTDDPGFQPIAVVNPGDRMAVVVKATRAGRLTVQGLPPGAYVTSCWTDRARWEREPDPCAGRVDVDDSGVASVTMPDTGVFSLTRAADVAP